MFGGGNKRFTTQTQYVVNQCDQMENAYEKIRQNAGLQQSRNITVTDDYTLVPIKQNIALETGLGCITLAQNEVV